MKTLFIIILLILLSPAASFSLPAFPGAEGMGASTTGARGYSGTPTVCKVTNLNDSGAGSLRNCVDGTGHDGTYVVFETSGNINLSSNITILSNYITIAGQTSPGGIAIVGKELAIGSSTAYGVHDIIIQHLRLRLGSHGYVGGVSEHSLMIWQTNNVVIDHCSISWGVDETMSATTYGGHAVTNLTMSWNMITQGLADPAPEANHGYGILINGTYASGNTVSMHHNYIASHQNRMPRVDGDVFTDYRYNVVYNWDKFWTFSLLTTTNSATVNFVGNYSKPGPGSDACVTTYRSGDLLLRDDAEGDFCDSVNTAQIAYVTGNAGCIAQEWAAVCGNTGLAPTAYQRSTPFTVTDIAITAETMDYTRAQEILQTVGASKPVRDSYDTAQVATFTAGTGSFLADVTYPDDFPTFVNEAVPTDSDNDGMADAWETATFGDLDQTAITDFDSDGYHDIEEYFHYLSGSSSPVGGGSGVAAYSATLKAGYSATHFAGYAE